MSEGLGCKTLYTHFKQLEKNIVFSAQNTLKIKAFIKFSVEKKQALGWGLCLLKRNKNALSHYKLSHFLYATERGTFTAFCKPTLHISHQFHYMVIDCIAVNRGLNRKDNPNILPFSHSAVKVFKICSFGNPRRWRIFLFYFLIHTVKRNSPGQATGKDRLLHLRSPNRKQTITAGVGILQCCTLPFLSTSGMPGKIEIITYRYMKIDIE